MKCVRFRTSQARIIVHRETNSTVGISCARWQYLVVVVGNPVGNNVSG